MYKTVNETAKVFYFLQSNTRYFVNHLYMYIYSSFDVDVCLILHVTQFHIHGVICMIVRHKENVLGSATYCDFYVSY